VQLLLETQRDVQTEYFVLTLEEEKCFATKLNKQKPLCYVQRISKIGTEIDSHEVRNKALKSEQPNEIIRFSVNNKITCFNVSNVPISQPI
jgi:hypothetical protein